MRLHGFPKQQRLLPFPLATQCNYVAIHDLAAGHRDINLKLTGQFSPCQLIFLVLEGVMLNAGKENVSMILQSTVPCMLKY